MTQGNVQITDSNLGYRAWFFPLERGSISSVPEGEEGYFGRAVQADGQSDGAEAHVGVKD